MPVNTSPTHTPPTHLAGRLAVLNEAFARAAIGDFSRDVPIPEDNSDLTDVFVGVQVMLDVIREKIREHENLNNILQHRIKQSQETLQALEEERQKLAEAKAKDETLLDSIGEGTIAINAQGKIMMMNPAAHEMLKMSSADTIGKSYLETVRIRDEKGNLVPYEDRPITQVLSSGKKVTTSNQYYERSDGSAFPVSSTASPIWYRHRLAGAIIVFHDRTRETAIDQAKSEFVSLASHQLRTPLTMINWYTQRLLSGRAGKLSVRQKHYLNEIHQGSKRMAELVQALLHVSRIELGTIIIEPEPTDLSTIIDGVLSDFRPQQIRKRLKITSQYPKQVPPVFVDPKLIRVVVQNLIGNAIKYTPQRGSVKIRLRLKTSGRSNSDNASVILSISDTGYGIPQEQQGKVFNKLFRASNVQARDTDGTGLGLYIVKSILKYSQGDIWFKSALNRGSTFYVSLPLTKSTEPPPANAS